MCTIGSINDQNETKPLSNALVVNGALRIERAENTWIVVAVRRIHTKVILESILTKVLAAILEIIF